MPNYHRVYEENRYLFITMVTYNRSSFLIKNIDLLRESFKRSKKKYEYELFGIIVLPDHIHMIIKPEYIKDYSNIIKEVKTYFSKNIDEKYISENKKLLSASKLKKNEKGVWQRRFWEHTIRDENDLYRHLDYIHYNPVKHKYVDNVIDWKYSSFHKFVGTGFYDKNWGVTEDVKQIDCLDFE